MCWSLWWWWCERVVILSNGIGPMGSAHVPLCVKITNHLICSYKACSKKDQNVAIMTLFYNIWSTVLFKLVPCTGDTPFPTFLPLLECFLECNFSDGTQFSYHIFLNLRVFKKRMNFLNSSSTSTEGTLWLLSAPSSRFWQQTAIYPVLLWALVVELHPLIWAHAQAVRRINPTNSLCTCSDQRM